MQLYILLHIIYYTYIYYTYIYFNHYIILLYP